LAFEAVGRGFATGIVLAEMALQTIIDTYVMPGRESGLLGVEHGVSMPDMVSWMIGAANLAELQVGVSVRL
jgi:hypothetical protein